MRFVRDYLAGLVRWTRGKAPSSLPHPTKAVNRYFANIDVHEYFKHHTSMNSDLFMRQVSSELEARVKPGWSIIDLGAGFCDLEAVLAAKLPDNSRLIAVDLQHHMLLYGRKRVEMDRTVPGLYLVTDVEKCALSDNCVDMAVCINVTPYLSSLNGLAEQIGRLLREAGELILVQPQRNPYWEEEFGEVRLNFFSNDRVVETFEHYGFAMIERRDLRFYFLPFLRYPSTVYASMLVFRKGQMPTRSVSKL